MTAQAEATLATSSPALPAYDVFNGDADGICALHQLRLACPTEAQLVTGVKRDIALLARLPCTGPLDVTVLDVSFDVNAGALRRILDAGGRVHYVDHHSAQQAFPHPQLRLCWDEAPDVCTSILVDRQLGGRYRRWAVAAAFGDNLQAPARALAHSIGLREADTAALAELGLLLNYNAYGECVDDLHFRPEVLYRALSPYSDPLDFLHDCGHYARLADGYREDCARMHGLAPYWTRPGGTVYLLPSATWARRISGVLANQLAARAGGASFAVLTENTDGSYVVSVRAGAPAVRSANGLCQQFSSGGGRKSAAGINRLPASELERFIHMFCAYFGLPDGAIAGANIDAA